MTSSFRKKLEAFKKERKTGQLRTVRVSGAGVGSADVQQLMKSEKVTRIVKKLNKSKLESANASPCN
ncbi:hypothetical protein [Cobetia marina]|uniref:hypothetical protein n=1 Tax=Cobetia marina TaxID=28258 RepID=UPI00384BFFD7